MKRKKREYKAAAGANFPAKKAQAIGEAIERIGDSVTPVEVLNAAKSSTVLKPLFQWDNKKAADSWRLHQARNILNHLNVVVVMPNGEKREMKAFYSQQVQCPTVTDEDGEESEPKQERRYLSIAVAEREPIVARNIVEDARRELREWKWRYSECEEYFGPVFKAIESVA